MMILKDSHGFFDKSLAQDHMLLFPDTVTTTDSHKVTANIAQKTLTVKKIIHFVIKMFAC